MAEPASSAAGGVVLWKALGGLAAVASLGAALASIVAMCMMTPRSPKEWAVGIISSVMSSLGGGAFVIIRLGMAQNLPTDDVGLFVALVAMLGLVFACGLPGWALVRAVFTWLDKRSGLDIGELAKAARADAVKIIAP